MNKVIIIGGGRVGMAYADALVSQDIANELGIINRTRDKARVNALDLMHAVPLIGGSPKKIYDATYADVADADIVVITANAPTAVFDENLDRLTLLKENIALVKQMTKSVMKHGFDGIFLIATNPVDILARAVQEVSQLPTSRVIGTGTLIDTARMQHIIANRLQINPNNVNGYVMGEHGKTSFTAWSSTYIGVVPIETWIHQNPGVFLSLDEVDNEIRQTGMDIFQTKGATEYGIAAALARITRAIFRNENTILPVTTYLSGEYGVDNAYVGIPAVINQTGVREILHVHLNDQEREKLARSLAVLEKNYQLVKESIESSISSKDLKNE